MFSFLAKCPALACENSKETELLAYVNCLNPNKSQLKRKYVTQ
jgi:hypothetical protein